MTERRRSGASIGAMSPPPSWALIVLRAWLDTDGLRVRLLTTDSAGRDAETVVASPDDAAVVVCAWLRAVTEDVTDG